MRRQYALIGQTIRFAGEEPCEAAPAPVTVQAPAQITVNNAPAPKSQEGFFERLKKRLKSK
jgi:hypothetical protein